MIIEKDCDKKEGMKKDSHKGERFLQMVINKKRLKMIFTDDHK